MNVDVRRAETVQQMAAKKRQLLGIIDNFEEEPHASAAVAEQGLPGTGGARDTGLVATVAECGRTLMETMPGCPRANEVNNCIIKLCRGQIQQLICIVRGVKGHKERPSLKRCEHWPRRDLC
jgi:hypothetical protein